MESKNVVENSDKKVPVFKLKVGNVDFAVWENQGNKGVFNSISFLKNYLDSEQKWQKTNNFNINDIPNLIVGFEKIYENFKIKNF